MLLVFGKSRDLNEVFSRFMARRLERTRAVVEASVKMSELELACRWEERNAIHVAGVARLMEPI